MQPRIERAAPEDRDEVFQLLQESDLPIDGLAAHLGTAIVARLDDEIVGSAALEIYGDGALLRSVAVARTQRGRGLGSELTRQAILLAESLQLPAIFLLTTTAESFFPAFGFERISRIDVPSGVQQSIEFTSACPATATVMRKQLGQSA